MTSYPATVSSPSTRPNATVAPFGARPTRNARKTVAADPPGTVGNAGPGLRHPVKAQGLYREDVKTANEVLEKRGIKAELRQEGSRLTVVVDRAHFGGVNSHHIMIEKHAPVLSAGVYSPEHSSRFDMQMTWRPDVLELCVCSLLADSNVMSSRGSATFGVQDIWKASRLTLT